MSYKSYKKALIHIINTRISVKNSFVKLLTDSIERVEVDKELYENALAVLFASEEARQYWRNQIVE